MDLGSISCMDSTTTSVGSTKRERKFHALELTDTTNSNQPILVIQSPKTPTLSRKLKAASLDSDPLQCQNTLEVARDVSSMPNTPKKQVKPRQSLDYEDNGNKPLLGPSLGSNLKKYASNTSISGSQTLKTLPEVMTLQDFTDSSNRPEPVRIKAKGLLERRGSNASLTIDLGSNSSITETKNSSNRLNTIKSASHLNLTLFSSDKCSCSFKNCDPDLPAAKRSSSVAKFQPHTENCAVNESSGVTRNGNANLCRNRCYTFHKKCNCLCNFKCRRKSLSNENLYVPPCGFCQSRFAKDCPANKHCKGCRRAVYPRQPNLELNQMLSEDFKLHLQNVQYLQTAGSILSIADLKSLCEPARVPKLHQEFWEVPLNLQEKCMVSGSQSKNRYKGVLPNEHSRVHLFENEGYIHANYIKGHDYTETAYIATQGPMEHTCSDFWEMVWSSECNCIVMLTGLIEKGKSKCELYFPLGKTSPLNEKTYFYVTTTKAQDKFTFETKNLRKFEDETVAFEELNRVKFGNYEIEFGKMESLGECVIRELKVWKSGIDNCRVVYHYWFPNWQDHKMANPEQVLDMALHVVKLFECPRINIDNCFNDATPRDDANDSEEKVTKTTTRRGFKSNANYLHNGTEIVKVPIVVHCSAGIGRTGCFLAILNGIRQLRNNFNVDVLAILCSLRLNRGGMVQTAEQYELIHRVLSLYTNCMETIVK